VKKITEGIISRIYSAREALLVAVFCVWMTYVALSSFGISAAISLASALIILLPLLASAFLLEGEKALHIGRIILFISALLHCGKAVHDNKDAFLFIGAVTFMTVIGIYCSRSLDSIRTKSESKAFFITAVACAALLYTVYLSAVTVSRYAAYRAPSFDFGIFAQAFWSLKERFIPYTTCERGFELSHFAVHLSPVFYLALPVYALFPRPETVQIIQAIALSLGVIPLWKISKRLGLSNVAATVFSLLYLVHPALTGGCMYDFHENCFLPVLLLWTVYFAEKGSLVPTLIFSVLTCSVKEDAAVYVAFLGLYLLFSGKRKALGTAMTALSVAYFLAACAYLNSHGLGVMAYRYNNLSSDGTLMGVIITALKDPFRIIKECTETEKLQFAVLMLLPLGVLPFATKKISRYVLFGGLLLVNLMPDYVYQYSIDFQYVFGSLALLFYLAMLNYADLKSSVRRSLVTLACTACMLTASARMPSHIRYITYMDTLSVEIEALDEAMTYVPDDVSVSASTFIVAHLANRQEIYEIEDMQETDYVVADLRYAEWDAYPAKYADLGYVVVFEVDDIVCVMKKSR